MLWILPLLLGMVVCAALAVQARPLVAALWLACCSALLSVALYLLNAPALAVVELSVGAGLITVLLAFAISMAEDDTQYRPVLPRWLSVLLVLAAAGGIVWLLWPGLAGYQMTGGMDASFFEQVWYSRQADLLLQIVIIFAGVVGVLNLLGDIQTVPQPDEEPREALS